MKTNRATCCLCAALSATLLALWSPGPCAAGAANDYPGVAKGDKFLAAGPLPVTVTFVVKKLAPAKNTFEEREAELLLLTEQWAIYRLKNTDGLGKVDKTPAASVSATKIAHITATDRKNKKTWTWEFDPATSRFTGAVRPAEKIEIKAAEKFTPEQTNQFLFFTYLWMVDQLEETVPFDKHELAKALIKKADRTADAINQLGLDRNVERLFRSLKLHHGDLIAVRPEIEKTLAAAAIANVELQQMLGRVEMERRWIESAQVSVVGLKFVGLLLGGKGSLAPDSDLMKRQLELLQQKLQADVVEKQLSKAVQDRIQELAKAYIGTIRSRKERDKAVCKQLGLPYVDWYAERSGDAASKNDWPTVAEHLTEVQNEYKKITPHGDPWLQLEICQTQSRANYTRFDNEKLLGEKAHQNAAQRYNWALQMFDIVPQTPAESSFKEFRGDLIFKAAEAAVLAAELELGEKATLRSVYNPKAVYALRLLDLAKGQNLEDVSRNVSEVRFRAMAHVQMHKEALDFGSQFAGSRDTAKFHLTMAKLHLIFATDKKLEASKEYTKKAIKAGFYDFQALASNADLKKVLAPDFIYENMAAEVTVRIDSDKKGKIKAFILTNNSPFAVFDGSFSVGKIVGWNVTRFGRYPIVANTNFQTIEFLEPKTSLVITDSNNVNNAFFAQQNPLYGFTVTNQGRPGFPVKTKLDR